ncbi:MAG: hypothetical protein RML40_01225 [Bacteroidota bacterium]|nr:hypothetical protein [Candidatus Kapabacteria bacterium]MDW8219130.1 hypothetical protein [Bacteroidota bacterium]
MNSITLGVGPSMQVFINGMGSLIGVEPLMRDVIDYMYGVCSLGAKMQLEYSFQISRSIDVAFRGYAHLLFWQFAGEGLLRTVPLSIVPPSQGRVIGAVAMLKVGL